MANVNLPLPVVIAGGALALLGGYLIGVVAGSDTPDPTTGVVESYTSGTGKLCLSGDAVSEQDGASDDGTLCGIWQHPATATRPTVGDSFRFVTLQTSKDPDGDVGGAVLIYGDVVD